jgi:hypothetical protein
MSVFSERIGKNLRFFSRRAAWFSKKKGGQFDQKVLSSLRLLRQMFLIDDPVQGEIAVLWGHQWSFF